MPKVNFYPSINEREVSDAFALVLKNRYFEQNPQLTDDGSAFISRPGLKRWLSVGEGPIRGVFSEPGTFNGDLFVASYDEMYRVTSNNVSTNIYTGLYAPDTGTINMAITANIGTEVPEYLFFCDGRNLYVYSENSSARGTLVGTPANTDVVRIDGVYYSFTTGSVNTGTPAGTSGNPWLVAIGVTGAASMDNLYRAIGATGTAGTTYSTALTAHPTVSPSGVDGTTLYVAAKTPGTIGNSIVTTETGAALAWGGGTLSGGGSAGTQVVHMPDDVGVIDVAVINSYVIVIPAQGKGINGRFYWIEPGEITIDPLNYATAERSPDAIYGVEVIGDQFWLPGESSIEVWYVNGGTTTPMQRLQGVVFDRGTWAGTAKSIRNTLIVCDSQGAVFILEGGTPKRVSTPAIEEQIRKAIQYQQSLGL